MAFSTCKTCNKPIQKPDTAIHWTHSDGVRYRHVAEPIEAHQALVRLMEAQQAGNSKRGVSA